MGKGEQILLYGEKNLLLPWLKYEQPNQEAIKKIISPITSLVIVQINKTKKALISNTVTIVIKNIHQSRSLFSAVMPTLPAFILVTRLMASVFPKKIRKQDFLQVAIILGFLLGGVQDLWWGFLHPQSWNLLGFLVKCVLLVAPASLSGDPS